MRGRRATRVRGTEATVTAAARGISLTLPGGVTLKANAWMDGPPRFFLIHGMGDCAFIWNAFAMGARALGASVAIDMRGHGDSARDPTASYRLSLHTADAMCALDKLTEGRVFLVGHSLGAAVAICLAAARPERIEGLVLVEGGVATNRAAIEIIRKEFLEQPLSFLKLEDYVKQLSRKLPLASAQLLRELAPHALRLNVGGQFELKCDLNVANGVATLDEAMLWALMRGLRCPILLVRGTWSGVLSRSALEAVARVLPHSEGCTVPSAGHAVPIENPAGLLAAVEKFVTGRRREL